MTYVVTQHCCNDATCVEACPVNCIHPTPDEPGYATAEMLYIDPDGCIDCGACVPECPVDAIVADFDLTEDDERYAEINAHYFADPAHQDYSATPVVARKPAVETAEREPLRVAIVGSGPAGCYAAEELLGHRGLDVEVSMFERLPTPWGLVRFGVAPDHQRTKSVTDAFTRTVSHRGLNLYLNVEVGTHVTQDELLAHHHAVIYAVGAASDRGLGIPGEDLPGSHSATDFVAWYNGHPDAAEQTFDLSCERAVIVGNGNVALDVARILASDVDDLAGTDIADHALAALAASRITEVVVLGRRAAAQAAFTTPELLGLTRVPGLHVAADPQAGDGLDPASMTALKVQVVRELADHAASGAGKTVRLRFLRSPVEILGSERVSGLRVVRNELAPSNGSYRASPTGETEDIECGLVLRSIGYRGTPLPGLGFDETSATLPNDGGRVVDPDSRDAVPGVYVAGWMKRGPSGVIGTNRKCAAETVRALVDDYVADRLTAPDLDGDALRALVAGRQPAALDYRGWQAIDQHERSAAAPHGRSRVKLVDVPEMLAVADRAAG